MTKVKWTSTEDALLIKHYPNSTAIEVQALFSNRTWESIRKRAERKFNLSIGISGKVVDLRNKQFGRLTVQSYKGLNEFRNAIWNCRCSCGNEIVTQGTSLTTGSTTSCGCYRSEVVKGRFRDLVGQRFGKLLVIKLYDTTKHSECRWLCNCDCGKSSIVVSAHLMSCHTRSCGCVKHSHFRRLSKKPITKLSKHSAKLVLRMKIAHIVLQAKKRDNFTCVICSSTTAIEGHHIIPIKVNLTLAGELTNIITLCKKCHYKAHDGNTQGPVNEDIKNKLKELIFSI